jgi:hypothetical protein
VVANGHVKQLPQVDAVQSGGSDLAFRPAKYPLSGPLLPGCIRQPGKSAAARWWARAGPPCRDQRSHWRLYETPETSVVRHKPATTGCPDDAHGCNLGCSSTPCGVVLVGVCALTRDRLGRQRRMSYGSQPRGRGFKIPPALPRPQALSRTEKGAFCMRSCTDSCPAPAHQAPLLVPISIETSDPPMICPARVFATRRSASRSGCTYCLITERGMVGVNEPPGALACVLPEVSPSAHELLTCIQLPVYGPGSSGRAGWVSRGGPFRAGFWAMAYRHGPDTSGI